MEKSEYVIQEGDTLTKIAFKNNISISKIKKLNNIGGDEYLYPGRKLKITETVGILTGLDINELENDIKMVPPELLRKRANSVHGKFVVNIVKYSSKIGFEALDG